MSLLSGHPEQVLPDVDAQQNPLPVNGQVPLRPLHGPGSRGGRGSRGPRGRGGGRGAGVIRGPPGRPPKQRPLVPSSSRRGSRAGNSQQVPGGSQSEARSSQPVPGGSQSEAGSSQPVPGGSQSQGGNEGPVAGGSQPLPGSSQRNPAHRTRKPDEFIPLRGQLAGGANEVQGRQVPRRRATPAVVDYDPFQELDDMFV